MREIIFRGKTKDGKWVYGDLVTMQNICIANTWHEVIRVKDETVGQYTGQEDKNGKKIFDGDLCYYFDSNCDEDDGGLKVVYEYGGYWLKGDGFAISFCQINTNTDVEVIGNIHDNPELLHA